MNIKEKKNLLRKLGHFIKVKRVERNLTQYDLAEIAESTAAHLGKIERGQTDLSFSMLIRIARALVISPKELMPE